MNAECPCCFRLTVGADRICTRCHVAVPHVPPVAPSNVGHRWFGHGPDSERVGIHTDYARTKEDKQ